MLISDLLQKEMAKGEGAPKIDMSVLMGANVANEVRPPKQPDPPARDEPTRAHPTPPDPT